MTNLPEWIEKASAFDTLRLRQALAIAWDAFENVKATPSGGCSNSHDAYADEAMRRIEKIPVCGLHDGPCLLVPERTHLDNIEKEAERIVEEIKQYFDTYRIPQDEQEAYKLSARKCIEHALRTVHDAAIKKAANYAASRPTGSNDDGMMVQSDIVATIRALKISPDGSGIGDGK